MKDLFFICILLFSTEMLFAPMRSKANNLSLPTKDWHEVCSRVDMNWVNSYNGYLQAKGDSFLTKKFSLIHL